MVITTIYDFPSIKQALNKYLNVCFQRRGKPCCAAEESGFRGEAACSGS